MHELLLILFFLFVIQFVNSANTTKKIRKTTTTRGAAEIAMEMALFDEDDEREIKVFEDQMPERGEGDGWGSKGCGHEEFTKSAGAGQLWASIWGIFLPIYMLGKRLILYMYYLASFLD